MHLPVPHCRPHLLHSLLPSEGIGYAETVDDDKKQSWNSLLQRYLARREPLRLVCHLVDSRHKVTPADRQVGR